MASSFRPSSSSSTSLGSPLPSRPPTDRRRDRVLPGEVEVGGVEPHGERVADDGVPLGGVVPAGQRHDRRVAEDRELGVGGGQDPLVLADLAPHRHPALALRRRQRARRVDRALLLAAPDPVLVGAHRALVEGRPLGDGEHEVAQHAGGLGEQPVDDRGRDGVGDRLAGRLGGPERDAGDLRRAARGTRRGRGGAPRCGRARVGAAPRARGAPPRRMSWGRPCGPPPTPAWVADTCQWHPSVAPRRRLGGTMEQHSRGCRGPSGGRFLARGKRSCPGGLEIRLSQEGPGVVAPGPSVCRGRAAGASSPQRPSPRGPRWRSTPRRNSVHRCTSSTSSIASAARASARERAQEAAVGLVLPRHRALAAPARATQRVEAAVVAGAGVRVRLDARLVGQGVLGEHRPGQAGRRVGGRHVLGAARRPALGGGVLGQVGRRDAEQVGAHGGPSGRVCRSSSSERTRRARSASHGVSHSRPLGRTGRRVSPGGCPPSAGSGRPRRRGRPCRPRPPCPRRAGRTASCCRPRRRSSARRCSSSASSRRPGG